ncbi:CHAT domain-containing tetratricopeptide repeat protein [Catalinimonas sp. 4WD22]|uniref:CHAT domain-containing protein n=1 Tax=Catalinimonas locisalis TaxID=3133978 RepID=UPI0031017FAB
MKTLLLFLLCFIFSVNVHANGTSEYPVNGLLQKAQSFEEKKETDSAAFYYLLAAEAFNKKAAWQESINAQKKAGDLYFGSRKSKEVIDNFNYLLDSLNSYLSDTLMGELYFKIGISHARLAQFVDALENLKQSCEIREQVLDQHDPVLGDSFHMLGRVYFTVGNYQQSLHYQQKYLKINQHNFPPDHMEVSDALHFVGLSYSRLFEHDLALEYYAKSASIVENSGKEQQWALSHIYNNMGLVYGRQKMFEKELEYFLKSLDMKKSFDMSYSDVYHNLGKTYIDLKQYQQAHNLLHEALLLKIAEVGERHTTVAGTYFYLAELHNEQQQYDSAIYFAEKSLAINQDNFGEKGTALAFDYKLLATLYQKQAAWAQSLTYLQKSIACLLQDYDKEELAAVPSSEEHVIDHLTLLQLMHQKGEVLMQRYMATKQSEDLQLAYQTSLAATDMIDHIYRNFNDPESRTYLADNANKILELALQAAFELQQQENNIQYLQAAFQLMEKNKAQLLLHNITTSQWKQQAGVDDSLLEKEQELNVKLAYYEKLRFEEEGQQKPDTARLSKYKNEIFALHREQEALNESLKENYPQYFRMMHEPNDITLAEAQKNLIQKNELMVEFFQGSDALYCLSMDKQNVRMYSIKADNLPVENLLQGLRNRDFVTYSESAYTLFDHLLKPVLRQHRSEKLIIIPDGSLGYIPFEALLTKAVENQNNGTHNYRSLPYLILDKAIAYQYSAQLLASVQAKNFRKFDQSFTGYAPAFSKQQNPLLATRSAEDRQLVDELEALPFAEEEVQSIAQLLKGNMHLSHQATEKNFKETASNSRIIHLASHTLIDDRNPLYSRLVFAPEADSDEDGLLHTYELYNMQLNADMVTLSACNTGVGKIQKGEGIISLARGFMYAGVPNVLMSLWAVSDRSTSQLMQNFYQALNNGSSKAEALRLAKLQYLEEADPNTAAPYYWSGFVLISNNQDAAESKFPFLYFLLLLIALILAGWFFYRRKSNRKTT